MVKCPECKSVEVERLGTVEVIDQVDEDEHYKYYVVLYSAICLNCNKEFTFEDDYKERK